MRFPKGTIEDNSLKTEAQEKDVEKNTEKSEITQPVTNTPVPQDALRVLRGWNEIAERAASGDMAALAFMRQGRAFTDADGRIHIRFPNDFALSMVNKAPHNENIRAALCLTLQRDIPDSQLVFGVISGEEEEETDLDDLNF